MNDSKAIEAMMAQVLKEENPNQRLGYFVQLHDVTKLNEENCWRALQALAKHVFHNV